MATMLKSTFLNFGTIICSIFMSVIDLISLLVYIQVTILKPLTTSPTSPERFVIAKGFHGCQPNLPEVYIKVHSKYEKETNKVEIFCICSGSKKSR